MEIYDAQDHLTYLRIEYADGTELEKDYYPDGGGIRMESSYNSEGNRTQGIWYREDGTLSSFQVPNAVGGNDGILYYEDGVTVKEEHSTNSDGRVTQMTMYYEDGKPSRKYQDTPDGGQIQSAYYPNGNLEYEAELDADSNWISIENYNEEGILTSTYEKLPDNAERSMHYNEKGVLEFIVTEYPDGSSERSSYDNNGNLKGKYSISAEGLMVSASYYPDGSVFSEHVNNPETGNSTKRYYDSGALKSYFSNSEVDGKTIQEDYYEDGTLQSRYNQTANAWEHFSPDGQMDYYEQWDEVKNVTRRHDPQGKEISYQASIDNESPDLKGYHFGTDTFEPDGKLIERMLAVIHDDGSYTHEFYQPDAQGKLQLVRTEKYDQYDRPIDDGKKAIVVPQGPAYTWYPNNTVSSMGLSFREVKPELTKKWYHFTPVDLSQDGEQVIPLVASNAFIVGRVHVNVKGDEVVVTYMARGQGSADTFRVHSEFLTFFPDLDSVTEVEPEKLGEGFKFGEPISIEKDLKGDTNVLLYVRSVASFNPRVTDDRFLERMWKNLPHRISQRDAMLALMDPLTEEETVQESSSN